MRIKTQWIFFTVLCILRVLLSFRGSNEAVSPHDKEPFVAATTEFLSTFRKPGAPPAKETEEQTAQSAEHDADKAHNATDVADEDKATEGPVPAPAPEPSGPKLWSIDDAILAVEMAKKKGELPAFARSPPPPRTKDRSKSKKASDTLQSKQGFVGTEWDIPEAKIIKTEEELQREREKELEDVAILERLMKGGLRNVREKNPDKTKVAMLLDKCHPPEDDDSKETKARFKHQVQPITEWILPAPEVTHKDGFVGFLHKVIMQHGEPQEMPATKGVLSGRPFRKCAVVGPAYSTAKMGYGAEIDRADIVVRLNQQPTSRGGYQSKVGIKTHLRFLNDRWVMQYGDMRLGKFLELEHNATLVLTQRAEETNNVKRVLTHLHRDDVQVLALNEKWFWSAHQLLLAYKICLKNGGADVGGGDSPTAGFLAVYSLMHVCHSLHVYGFSSEKTRAGEVRTYFKDDLPRSMSMVSSAVREGKHSYEAEYALIKALAADGRFTLCGVKGCRKGPLVFADTIFSDN